MSATNASRAAKLLVRAEERLRAEGLTGSAAFEELVRAVRARLGDAVATLPVAEEAVAELPMEGFDLVGLAYERFFPDLFKGKRGQYFTPRPLVEFLLSIAKVCPGERVLDPTCGSGGFLVCAARYGAVVQGIERDPLLVELARLNLRLANLEGEVVRADFFAAAPRPVDLVVANPPFSVPMEDPSILERYDLGRAKRRLSSDALFVEALERWVVPGGRAAVVLPWSILVNPSSEAVRARLLDKWTVEAVCGLPEGVFRPFGGAAGRACLLWLREGAAAGVRTRWAEVRDPGWDVHSQRLRETSSPEIARLCAGEGWSELTPGKLVPDGLSGTTGVRLRTLVRLGNVRRQPGRDPQKPVVLLDLADVDKATGEVLALRPQPGAGIDGAKLAIQPGDLLVSRLRPELRTVGLAPESAPGELVGSTEWVVLTPHRLPHFLLVALRTLTWSEGLPVTHGQTRPRTTSEAVLDSIVPWPGDSLAVRIDALARDLHHKRAALRDALLALEAAMGRFAAGEISEEELSAEVAHLEFPG